MAPKQTLDKQTDSVLMDAEQTPVKVTFMSLYIKDLIDYTLSILFTEGHLT